MADTAPNEVFNQIMKATGQRLKPLGFARHGAVLRIRAQGNCGLIEFQRSVKSSSDALVFTVNVGIVCGEIMDSEAPLQDLQKARFIHAQIRWRIGAFLPGCPDKWWEIARGTDPDVLSREVSDVILQQAVPAIRRCLSTDSIISLWESGQSPGLTDGHRADLLASLKSKWKGGAA